MNELRWGVAVAIGVVLGLVAAIGNAFVATTDLVQMGTPWVATAAVAGALATTGGPERIRRSLLPAAVAGGVALVVANLVYYGLGTMMTGSVALRFFIVWTLVGLVIGPVSGMLGRIVAQWPWRPALVATALLAASALGEALALWPHIVTAGPRSTFVLVAALAVVAALILPINRRPPTAGARDRAATLVLALALAYPLAVIMELAMIGLGMVSAPARLLGR